MDKRTLRAAVASACLIIMMLVSRSGLPVRAQAGSLPAGWQSRDVGVVGQPGSASTSAGTFTVSGSGAQNWGTADAFHFAYRSFTGDLTIVAQVTSLLG